MKRPALLATVWLAPVSAVHAQEDLLPPPEDLYLGPRRDGIVFGLEIGGAGCPDCPVAEGGGFLTLRGAYRFAVGLALGGELVVVANDESTCTTYDYYYEECTEASYDLTYWLAEARWYPLFRSELMFDPYVGVGFGSGHGNGEGTEDDRAGWVAIPRMGAVAIFGSVFSIGGTLGRTFSEELPAAWVTGLEMTFRVWGP
jgi:hypothetical protein